MVNQKLIFRFVETGTCIPKNGNTIICDATATNQPIKTLNKDSRND